MSLSFARKNSWWRSLFSRTVPVQKKASLHYRPTLLSLEDRITPNATISIAGGVMSFTGDNGANDLTFTRAAGNYVISDSAHQIDIAAGTLGVVLSNGNKTATFPANTITSLNFSLLTDNGLVTLGNFDAAIAPLALTGSSNTSVLVANTANDVSVGGALSITGFNQIDVQKPVAATGTIFFAADRMNITQAIDAGANRVTLQPASAGKAINLGGADSGAQLGLTDAELDFVTAGVLQIGSTSAGAVNVSAAIAPANANTLSLRSGAGMSGAGSLAVANADFSAGGAVSLSGGFTTLAGSSTAGITINNNAGLNLGSVDSISGLNAGGVISVTVAGALTVANNVAATGANAITLTTTDAASAGQNITVNTAVAIQSGTGNVNLLAGDDLTIASGATLQSSGAGQINLSIDVADADAATATLTAVGATISAPAGANYLGNSDDDAFIISASLNTPISVNGAAGTNPLQIDAQGNSLTISSTGFTVAGHQAITTTNINTTTYVNASGLSFVGTSGNDTFTVDLAASTVQVNGGTAYDYTGLPISFDGLGGNDTLTLNGSNADEKVIYRTVSGVPGNTEYNVNGGTFVSMTNMEGFRFNGLGGSDQLTVDYVNGDPVGTLGVDFDGGTGSDILVVTSPLAAGRSGSYTPSGTTPGTGQVNVGADQIRFANLQPVDVTGFTNFTLLLPNSNDTVNIVGGPAFSNSLQPALILSGDSNGTAFETLAVWNVTNLTVDTTTVDGADAITLGNTGAAAGHQVTNLRLTTGASADTVGVSGTVNLAGSLTFDLGTGANVLTFTTATVNAPTGISQTGTGSNVLAGGTTLLNATTGDINLANDINGTALNTQNLSFNTTSGNVIVNNIGNTVGLNTLTMTRTTGNFQLGGGTYRAGTQTYNGPVALSAGSVLFDGSALNGVIAFNNTLTGASSAVTITTSGDTNFNGAVNVSSLTTNGGGNTNSNAGTITTSTTQTYFDAVKLLATTTFASTGGSAVTFNNAVDGPGGATINTTGNTIFNSTIGSGTALSFLTTNAGGVTFINNSPTVVTTGAQTYGDAVRIGANTNFQSTGNAAITFTSTLDSVVGLNFSATVTTTGITTFGGAVGNSDALSALSTNAGGTTNVNGGSVTTTGLQTYGDAVRLGANTTFTSTGGGAITFNSTLDSAIGFTFSATVNTTGSTTFAGAVGGQTTLSTLTTDANGTTFINGGAITTTGVQNYNDNVQLGVTAMLTSTGSGNITFAGNLDGPGGITVVTGGVTTFGNPVGSATPLAFITTDGPGSTVITRTPAAPTTLTTTGAQTFNDPVQLLQDATFTSNSGGNITFNSTLNGPGGATITTSGSAFFNGLVGGITPLAFLTSGTTTVNTSAITTTGAQNYGNTTLSTAIIFTTSNANLSFNGTLNSSTTADVTINIGTGDLLFNGVVSNLGNLLIQLAHNVTNNAAMTVATFVQVAGTGTTQFNGPTTITRARPFGGTYEIDITTNGIVINANLIATGFDTRFNPQANGVNELSGSVITGILRLEGTGAFLLNQPLNDITGSFSANVNGAITLRDANDLVIKPDGSSSIPGGVVTTNDNVTITTGRNFTADNAAVTLIDIGTGAFQMTPGVSGPSSTFFNTEIIASSATFGSSILGTGNISDDDFQVRPSANVSLTVYGNLPQAAVLPPGTVGDTILPIFTDPNIPVNLTTTPIPGTSSFDGNYHFGDGTIFKDINFFSMEGLKDLRTEAVVYQTTAGKYAVLLKLFQSQFAIGIPSPVNFVENTFVVAPARVNPAAPYSAPKVAFGDVDGNGLPDLIVAGGSNSRGVVTVIKGEELFNLVKPNAGPIRNDQILTQFYAFEPTFFGGLYVAAGNVRGDSKAEIIVGSDAGRASEIRVFSYNPLAPGKVSPIVQKITTANAALAGFSNKGVRVAVGNVTGGAYADIIAGSGSGVVNKVSLIKGGTLSFVRSFSPYPTSFKGGVYVSTGDFNGDGFADVLTGPGASSTQQLARLLVVSGQMLAAATPPPPPPVGTTNTWYLFNRNAEFKINPTGVQPTSWLNYQGVSSVSFAKLSTGQVTIVAGAPRGYGTQLIRYKTATSLVENFFSPAEQSFSDSLFKNYRDGAWVASA